MNRERLLFVSVVAILGLWFFLRSPEPPRPAPKPPDSEVKRRPILPAAHAPIVLGAHTGRGLFTQPSNVRPHPRPLAALEQPKPFDLPNVWPPTSRSVSTDRLDQLRRDAAAPQPGAATIALPKAAAEGAAAGTAAEERVDTWKSKATDQRGHVYTIVAGGAQLREPPQPWPYGAAVLKPTGGADPWKFLRALVQLDDPERAVPDEGVKAVWAKSARIGDFKQDYPADINEFRIAVAGKQQGYLKGLKAYLAVRRSEAFDPRLTAGQRLLDEGLGASKEHREGLLRWSLALLSEARERVPAGAEDVRRTILLSMLRAAGALNDHDLVLSLAIDHLKDYPETPEVLEAVGNVLASRSFSLAPFAIEFFKRASAQPSAQRRLIEELVREGRFEEAGVELAAGRAGAGPELDLLKARVALAQGDLQNAAVFAARHEGAGGTIGADALQLLGAVAYAKGDAAAAAQKFEQAAVADPSRSTAFSDWGFALAVAGRTEDALLCFAQALELDAIDNAVAPQIGRGYLKLAAGEASLRAAADAEEAGRKEPKVAKEKEEEAKNLRAAAKEEFAAAAALLGKLQDDNRSDLLVRYMLGYAKERTGNLKEAAELYRATIDGDSRYRIAIARLGVVQSQLALDGKDPKDAAAAIAHLSKAVELSPQEAILPYVLARFLMISGQELTLADRMFGSAVKLDVSERNGNLPLWAELGQACLAYADEKKEFIEARRLLNSLKERIKDKMPAGTVDATLMEHEVYRAATINLQVVDENEKKVDRMWDFSEYTTKPTDWKPDAKTPMEIRFEPGKGLVFNGKIDYDGQARTPTIVLERCSMKYAGKEEITGGSFWALELKGTIPPGGEEPAEFGFGIVQPRKGDQVLGILVRRKRSGNLEIGIDGGDRQVFKAVKLLPVELKGVAWPEGEFHLKLEVVPDYGPPLAKRRAQGKFRLFLNGEEVFLKEYKDQPGERANIFTQGKASQQLELYLWVEGREGAVAKEIQVKAVTLTVESK